MFTGRKRRAINEIPRAGKKLSWKRGLADLQSGRNQRDPGNFERRKTVIL